MAGARVFPELGPVQRKIRTMRNYRLNFGMRLGMSKWPQHFWVNSLLVGGNVPWMILIPFVCKNSATGTKSRSAVTKTAAS